MWKSISCIDPNLAMTRRYGVFQKRTQFFAQLLARPYTGVFDPDVFVGLKAGEQDQVPSQIGNSHRLPHIENTYLSTLGNGGGLQDKLAGFGDGHEVSAHVRMSYGHRATLCNLLFENWDDTTA